MSRKGDLLQVAALGRGTNKGSNDTTLLILGSDMTVSFKYESRSMQN